MVQQQPIPDLWTLSRHPYVDAAALSQAIKAQASDADDYRSRLLIRDSMTVLERHWDKHCFVNWLEHSTPRTDLDRMRHEHFERSESLKDRIAKNWYILTGETLSL